MLITKRDYKWDYKKIMSAILKMIFLRFKVFKSTVQKVSVFSCNCIFFGNSTFLYFSNVNVLFIFLVQLLQCNFHAFYVPCSNFFWQVFLTHTSHTSHHCNRSAMPSIGIWATLTDYFLGGSRGREGASKYLSIMPTCPKLQNVNGKP